MIKINFFKKNAVLYTSIDELPIGNWFKIHEKGDLMQLIKIGGVIKGDSLGKAWSSIYDEFIDTFGITDEFREYLNIKRDIEILEIDMIVEDDRSLLNFIAIKQLQLKERFENSSKEGIRNAKVYAEKFMRNWIDEKTMSTRAYYEIIDLMKKSNARE